jgi:hypothetical protein
MAEVRKQLSEFQFTSIVECEKELAALKEAVEKAQQKHQIVIGLILDAHGVLGQKISFDPNTKELVIPTDDDLRPLKFPNE